MGILLLVPQQTKPKRDKSKVVEHRRRIHLRRKNPIEPTGPKRPAKTGRYTPPIPKGVKHSPVWYPYLLLTLLISGVIIIILNYIGVLPSSPTNWYTLGGLLAIVTGALLATRYH